MTGVDKSKGPSLDLETVFWSGGLSFVAGIDEVGRGALAGPLVAAAVVLPQPDAGASGALMVSLHGVRDSKQLRPEERDRCAKLIRSVACDWAIGQVEADELDEIGVSAANRLAMERAVLNLRIEAGALLIDARVIDLGLPQIAPIRGDQISLSIASAAILAKVERDRQMVQWCERDRRYGFARHKGYGTSDHLDALRRHGPSGVHRHCFALPQMSVPEPPFVDVTTRVRTNDATD